MSVFAWRHAFRGECFLFCIYMSIMINLLSMLNIVVAMVFKVAIK